MAKRLYGIIFFKLNLLVQIQMETKHQWSEENWHETYYASHRSWRGTDICIHLGVQRLIHLQSITDRLITDALF